MAASERADLNTLLARLGRRVHSADESAKASPVLPTGWAELDGALPDGGVPLASVVELVALHGLGGATSMSLVVMRAAQQREERGWCAWVEGGIDAPIAGGADGGSLYAPGVALSGVDLARLLVVRPSQEDLPRVAVTMAQSGAFEVMAVDLAQTPSPALVRKLALSVEQSGGIVLLLTDGRARRPLPLPVALRLELSRTDAATLSVRVAKERRGRVGVARAVAMRSRPMGMTG